MHLGARETQDPDDYGLFSLSGATLSGSLESVNNVLQARDFAINQACVKAADAESAASLSRVCFLCTCNT